MLTAGQKVIVKAYVEADQVLNALPHNGDSADQIRIALITVASPAFYVYRTDMPKQEVQNAIVYSAMTPAQTIPSNNTAEALQIWIAKNLLSQGKQFNLQNLLLGGETVNFALANVRSGFQDALTSLPTKSDGTNQQAGWTALQLLISRPATIIEKMLATGTGSQAVPATMGFEGFVSTDDIQSAMGW